MVRIKILLANIESNSYWKNFVRKHARKFYIFVLLFSFFLSVFSRKISWKIFEKYFIRSSNLEKLLTAGLKSCLLIWNDWWRVKSLFKHQLCTSNWHVKQNLILLNKIFQFFVKDLFQSFVADFTLIFKIFS